MIAASVESARADVVIVNRLGLHARAASKLVTLAVRFRAQVQLEKDGHRVDAKSIMGVLLLCGTPGSTLTVTAEGEDAQEESQHRAGILSCRESAPGVGVERSPTQDDSSRARELYRPRMRPVSGPASVGCAAPSSST